MKLAHFLFEEKIVDDGITAQEAKKALKMAGISIDGKEYTLKCVIDGMNHELEHSETVHDSPTAVLKIAIDHLEEDPDYYKKLKTIEESLMLEKYTGPKKYSKRTASGKIVRYGAKGYSIAPGTSKGNRYCARSYGQMKKFPKSARDPNSPLRLSRLKWKCAGKYSKK